MHTGPTESFPIGISVGCLGNQLDGSVASFHQCVVEPFISDSDLSCLSRELVFGFGYVKRIDDLGLPVG